MTGEAQPEPVATFVLSAQPANDVEADAVSDADSERMHRIQRRAHYFHRQRRQDLRDTARAFDKLEVDVAEPPSANASAPESHVDPENVSVTVSVDAESAVAAPSPAAAAADATVGTATAAAATVAPPQ